ncbi:piggyBac transposable element-derived protein 4-like, partial [Octopus sinensis]|uniref:PiggyBac transposable element-derived protein 4-like n=1 Tax=Octopus sinensis TaxID=2607531 RepID=A0A7E6EJZ9_9MOLL
MTRTRFLKLTQYLHVRDTSSTPVRGEPGFDPLFKIRPIIDCVLNTYKTVYKPGRWLSIDEGMVGYKGRVRFRKYMPGKPTKWWIKVWKNCESNTGYCSGFEFYTGKRDNH